MISITIKEKNGKKAVSIPWVPDEIEYDSGGKRYASYTIMGKGEVKVPNGVNISSISWKGTFPGKKRSLPLIKKSGLKSPESYRNQFDSWRKNDSPLNLIISKHNINMDVYVSDFSCTYTGGYGDIEYNVKFEKLTEIKIVGSKKIKRSTNSSKKPTSSAKTSYNTYTVKNGDTLWGIAQKFLGSGAKYNKIYTLNKTVIESTAKKRGLKSSDNGHWIFAGTKLKIPQ